MTPYEIKILLDMYTSPADSPQFINPNNLGKKTLAKFMVDGLVVHEPDTYGLYKATDRLRAYCEGLQLVPLPEWSIPSYTPQNKGES